MFSKHLRDKLFIIIKELFDAVSGVLRHAFPVAPFFLQEVIGHDDSSSLSTLNYADRRRRIAQIDPIRANGFQRPKMRIAGYE